jgi:hypothetical protein
MLLLEKSVLDRIRKSPNPKEAAAHRRILEDIRKMESERQLDVLSTHYTEQREKQTKAEEQLIEFIRQQGVEKVRKQLAASGMPFQDQQRLIMQGSGSVPIGGEEDLRIIATVLERLDGLMQMTKPEQVAAAIGEARRGINTFNIQMEAQIEKLEHELQPGAKKKTPKQREKLLLEISKMTLSLMQPLTVINSSIEAVLTTTNETLRKDLLDMAYQSGQSLNTMTKKMIALTGYPELNEADGHLDDWKDAM